MAWGMVRAPWTHRGAALGSPMFDGRLVPCVLGGRAFRGAASRAPGMHAVA